MKENTPVWKFSKNESGISIEVQNIFETDMYGTEDVFGADIEYDDFAEEHFDECVSYEDVLETFIYKFENAIERSLPFDYMPDCWNNYQKNEMYLSAIAQAKEECKAPLKKLWEDYKKESIGKLDKEEKKISSLLNKFSQIDKTEFPVREFGAEDFETITKILEEKICDIDKKIRGFMSMN